jgi:hypothetical protein
MAEFKGYMVQPTHRLREIWIPSVLHVTPNIKIEIWLKTHSCIRDSNQEISHGEPFLAIAPTQHLKWENKVSIGSKMDR